MSDNIGEILCAPADLGARYALLAVIADILRSIIVRFISTAARQEEFSPDCVPAVARLN